MDTRSIDFSVIQPFIEQCLSRFKGITSIWLFGSRANNTFRKDSDWDLLIFADKQTLDLMRKATELKHSNVDVLVVYDGSNSEEPWPKVKDGKKPKSLDITGLAQYGWMEWKEISPVEATYAGDQSKHAVANRLKTIRLWPPQ